MMTVHIHVFEKIRRLLAGVLEQEGMEIVDLKVVPMGGRGFQ